MTGQVPAASILCMAVSAAVGIGLPIALCAYFKVKKKADLVPFFIGCAVFIVFALMLETAAHNLILSGGLGEKIKGNVWVYALYAGFMAGLFEETGRYVAFKTVLKKYRGKDINALMYGAGHGGVEALLLLGTAMISNIVMSVVINLGLGSMITGSAPQEALSQITDVFNTLINTPSYTFLLGSVERISAVAFHIAASVLVWFAAKRHGKFYLYPLAVLLHLALDALTVVLSGFELNVFALEAAIAVFAAVTVLIAVLVWKKNKDADIEQAAMT